MRDPVFKRGDLRYVECSTVVGTEQVLVQQPLTRTEGFLHARHCPEL